jgi:hypothetical protein
MEQGLGLAPAPQKAELPAKQSQQGLNLMQQAQEQYPILRGLGLGYKENFGGGIGYLETWPKDETGTPGSPRPKEFPMGTTGIEVYNPKTRPIDIMGDVASHYLIQTDPTVKAFYEQFQQSMTPRQRDIMKEQYQHARQNEGETRPYDIWHAQTGLPGYFRGYAFDQWGANAKGMYTTKQIEMFDKMKKYLSEPR